MSDKKYAFVVNGEKFEVSEPRIDGLQARLLAQLGPEVALVIEGSGDEEDKLISDTDRVGLESGIVQFYTKPPTVFGQKIDERR